VAKILKSNCRKMDVYRLDNTSLVYFKSINMFIHTLRVGQQILKSDKDNKGKRGISFVQLHKGHTLSNQYFFIEAPKNLGKLK